MTDLDKIMSHSRMWPADKFFRAKRDEQDARHHQFDNVEYGLEPNVKTSPGGLRDLQTAIWVMARKFGTTDPEDLEKLDTLRDGTQIFFRPVKPTDETALSKMLYSLSAASVQKRYFTYTKRFPHKDVQKLTNIDYDQNLAILGVVPKSGADRF